MDYLKKHPRRQELIEKGKLATFYGVPATEMDLDDLFMLLGHIGEEKAREEKFRRRELEVLRTFTKAR